MTNEKTIRPVFSLPDKTDVATLATAIIPAINPTTPIPPAVELRPFFSGRMPLPPSVDEAYQVIKVYITDKFGRKVLKHRIGPSEALENFKEQAASTLKQAFIDYAQVEDIQAAYARRHKTPLAVHLNIYFATPWRRDLDGPIKYAVDAAFERIGLNDNQVVHIDPIDKQVDARDPHVEVEIRRMLSR